MYVCSSITPETKMSVTQQTHEVRCSIGECAQKLIRFFLLLSLLVSFILRLHRHHQIVRLSSHISAAQNVISEMRKKEKKKGKSRPRIK